MFHRVYLEPAAYDHYLRTGGFREGTMLALAIRRPERRVPPSRAGWTEGELAALGDGGEGYGALRGRLGLLRLRPERGAGARPSRRALRPLPRARTRRSTTCSCSSTPSFGGADGPPSCRPLSRAVSYPPNPIHPITHHRSSAGSSTGPPRPTGEHGYATAASALAPAAPPHAPLLTPLASLLTLLMLCALGSPEARRPRASRPRRSTASSPATEGPPLADAIVVALHVPSGTAVPRRRPHRRCVQHPQHAGRRTVPGDGHA